MYFWFLVFCGINGLLVTALAMHVSYNRVKLKIANGDAGNIRMLQAIRAHGNSVEHTVLFGLLLVALVFAEVAAELQAILVVGFTLARFLHAYAMLFAHFQLRRLAAAATYFFELSGCVAVLYAGNF